MASVNIEGVSMLLAFRKLSFHFLGSDRVLDSGFMALTANQRGLGLIDIRTTEEAENRDAGPEMCCWSPWAP